MSEQPVTNVTENEDTENNQPQEDSLDAAALQGTIGHLPDESQRGHVDNASQLLGAGSSEVSVTEDTHEQPRKRAKRIIRSMPGSSCLRCKVKKTKCEPSDIKERTCKRYVILICTERTGYLIMISVPGLQLYRCESGNHECQYPTQRCKFREADHWTRVYYYGCDPSLYTR